MATYNVKQSRYLKPQREEKVFGWIAMVFFFTLFVLPQYFGVPFPLFDLTALRIMIVIVLVLIIGDTGRIKDFVNMIIKESFSPFLIPYMIVLCYTLVLRVDINALLNPLIELMTLYLLIYMIRDSLGVEKTVRMIIAFTYVIAFLGLVEYVIGRSPFSYLETIGGIYTGRFVRSGSYRIMGSCNHSLGYGLMLVASAPFSCYDVKKGELNVLKRPVLLVMLLANVFLCGSRSTLSVFCLEVFFLILLSTKKQMKTIILVGVVALAAAVVVLIAIQGTSIGRYILLQITSIIDELLGTEIAVKYGADPAALGSSSNYRAQLKYVFFVDWLNPFLGLGRSRTFSSEINGSYIKSIDNFYIAEFVRYAYPGLIAYLLFLGKFLVGIIKRVFQSKEGLSRILLVGTICYMINLLWVDSLQTLKYLYIIFAIFVCLEPLKQEAEPEPEVVIKKSKYLK